jgi:HEPN domain-containing protein
MSTSYKLPEEWFKQADYDLGTAKAMLRTRRYIYTVFMCHPAIEKALKGIYAKKLRTNPSKTHNLNYLCEEINLELPENFRILLII